MRWTLLIVFALSGCTSSGPARETKRSTTASPVASRPTTGRSGGASEWWRHNPYVTRKNGQFIVGNLAMVRGDFASLIAMPTVQPSKAVDVPILKAVLARIGRWLSAHSGEALCEAVIQLRSTCDQAVNAVFKRLPRLKPMRDQLDFYSGNKAKDFAACAHEQTFHPLVLCTVDWKRTYEGKDVCLAYAICVAGYTKLVSLVRTARKKKAENQEDAGPIK